MRPSMTTVRTEGAVDGREAGPMTAATWGCCPAPRRPGELLTRGDVCHLHTSRAVAERWGVLLAARPIWSGSMRSGPRSTARRGRCPAPRAAGLRRRRRD